MSESNMSKAGKGEQVEYDFSGGVRGKHIDRLKNGHKTIVTKRAGNTEIYITRPVILDRDVQSVFKDSKAVNKALRKLIEGAANRVTR